MYLILRLFSRPPLYLLQISSSTIFDSMDYKEWAELRALSGHRSESHDGVPHQNFLI